MGTGETLWLSIFQTLVLHLIFKATHKMKPGSIPQMRKARSWRLSDTPRAEVPSLPGSQKTGLPAGSASPPAFPQVRWLESRSDEGGAGETDYGVLMLIQEAFFSWLHHGSFASYPSLLQSSYSLPQSCIRSSGWQTQLLEAPA